MTLKITVPAEVESRLKGEASLNGLDIEAYASKLIADRFPQKHTDIESSDENASVRGVLPVGRERSSLFAETITARIEDLPKWSPQIVVSRRALTEDDDA